jgi:hypothetical protein
MSFMPRNNCGLRRPEDFFGAGAPAATGAAGFFAGFATAGFFATVFFGIGVLEVVVNS